LLPERQARPVVSGTGSDRVGDKIETSLRLRADQALRCAWLRVHADMLGAVDPTGQLRANLLDFADLLEVAEDHGWFGGRR